MRHHVCMGRAISAIGPWNSHLAFASPECKCGMLTAPAAGAEQAAAKRRRGDCRALSLPEVGQRHVNSHVPCRYFGISYFQVFPGSGALPARARAAGAPTARAHCRALSRPAQSAGGVRSVGCFVLYWRVTFWFCRIARCHRPSERSAQPLLLECEPTLGDSAQSHSNLCFPDPLSQVRGSLCPRPQDRHHVVQWGQARQREGWTSAGG